MTATVTHPLIQTLTLALPLTPDLPLPLALLLTPVLSLPLALASANLVAVVPGSQIQYRVAHGPCFWSMMVPGSWIRCVMVPGSWFQGADPAHACASALQLPLHPAPPATAAPGSKRMTWTLDPGPWILDLDLGHHCLLPPPGPAATAAAQEPEHLAWIQDLLLAAAQALAAAAREAAAARAR